MPLPRAARTLLAPLLAPLLVPLVTGLLVLPLITLPLIAVTAVPAAAADAARHRHTSWTTTDDLRAGTTAGTVVRRGSVRLGAGTTRTGVDGRAYDRGSWTSPWVAPRFELTELIPSWQATTRRNTFIDVHVRGRRPDGTATAWDHAARWTSSERWVDRTTFGTQDGDGHGMDVDTWQSSGVVAWQVRTDLHRRAGRTGQVRLERLGAVASRVPARSDVPTSRTGPANGVVLPVPAFSQMVHSGHYPQWGGGGQAWCSPTSVSMVLAFWDALPDAAAYSWVPGDHPAPWVDHGARMSYDHGYDGAGNWAFNTAYAGGLVEEASVTRLPSLRAAERFIAAGVPLVVSIAFDAGELRGAPIGSSAGHLLVVRGFQADGDVVVNDPAADPAQGERVRRVYPRGQLEDVWQTASDGLAYVVRD